MSLDLKVHDVQAIVNDAITNVRAELDEKAIALKLELADTPVTVTIDPVRLQQVFWNLLKNAVKFTPKNGTITVSSKVDETTRTVGISIADTGIGLNPDELARIFDAFAQGDHATKNGSHRFGGLGLGLAISRSLVEHQHGTLTAKSEGAGRGATFTVELPLATNQPATDGQTATDAAEKKASPLIAGEANARPDRRKVMLVEDHEPTQKTLALLLQRRKYQVSTASSLAGARLLLRDQKFDFLISDIGLPDGLGFELLQEMKLDSDVQGIALTGYGMEEDIERSRDAGFSIHLTKPVGVESLDKALAELNR